MTISEMVVLHSHAHAQAMSPDGAMSPSSSHSDLTGVPPAVLAADAASALAVTAYSDRCVNVCVWVRLCVYENFVQ